MGQLPGLHGLRHRLPVGRAVRQAHRGHARAGRAALRQARGPSGCARRALFELFPHPGRLRALAPFVAARRRLRPERALGDAARACARWRASRRPAAPARRCARLPELTPARGTRRGPGRLPAGLRPARLLRRRQRGDGRGAQPPRAGRSTRRACRAAAARCSCTPGYAEEARALARDDDRGLRGLRRRRGQRRRLRLGAEGLRAPASATTRPGRSARRRSARRCATSASCWPSTSRSPRATPSRCAVAYHDACHLAHAQGVRAQPRALLRAIPELELREPAEWEICCGSAGVYNLLKPEPAGELGERKARNLLAAERRPGRPPPTPAARCRSPPPRATSAGSCASCTRWRSCTRRSRGGCRERRPGSS